MHGASVCMGLTQVLVPPCATLHGPVWNQLPCDVLQLLSPEEQNQKVRQIIQQYGQDLTATDARLALEYYWQAAAVVDASQAVKVQPSAEHAPLCMDVHA